MPSPKQHSLPGVKGLQETPDAEIAPGTADEDLVPVSQGSHRVAVTVFRFAQFGRPLHSAAMGVQGHQPGVHRCQKHLVATDGHALVVGPATQRRGFKRNECSPYFPTLFGIQFDHLLVALSHGRGHVHGPAHDDRSGLVTGIGLDLSVKDPGGFQFLDILGIDLVQRRVANLAVGSTVHRPVLRSSQMSRPKQVPGGFRSGRRGGRLTGENPDECAGQSPKEKSCQSMTGHGPEHLGSPRQGVHGLGHRAVSSRRARMRFPVEGSGGFCHGITVPTEPFATSPAGARVQFS